MSVPAAYLAVVIIWSTTPLGIVWSSESVDPTLALFMRMAIAAVLGLVLVMAARIRVLWTLPALQVYMYSSLSMFAGMLMVYFAAAHISSGLMSLIYGLAPIISGLLAQRLLSDKPFTLMKKAAMTLALIGLAIVCMDNIALTDKGLLGIALVLGSVCCFSLSGVLVKRVKVEMHALSTTVGALWMSLPLFFAAWWFTDGTLPVEQWSDRSLYSIAYLGIFGSLVGFVAYFYVLQRLEASTVSLVTLITPVFALALGALLNKEPLSVSLLSGGAFVLVGLGLFLFGHKIRGIPQKSSVEH